MLHLKCIGQDMKVAIDERIADKYINANKVHFEFCERWNGMTITAQFTQKQKDEETQEEEFKTYNVLVDPVSSTVIMPNEIEAGDVYISAFGVHPNTGVRITSVPIKKTVDKSGFVDNGETPIPPTPDLYAQLIKSFAPTGANRQYISDSDGKPVWEALHIRSGKAAGSVYSIGTRSENVGTFSFALGTGVMATGNVAFAIGSTTEASGEMSFSSGISTKASGKASSGKGMGADAQGDYSSAEGYYTRAYGENQHVQGKWNKEDNDNRYAHIVGNGEDGMHRSNAHTLDWDGNAWFKGKVYVGGTSMDDAQELGTGGGSIRNVYIPYDVFTGEVTYVNAYSDPECTQQLTYAQGYEMFAAGARLSIFMDGNQGWLTPLLTATIQEEKTIMCVCLGETLNYINLVFTDSIPD